ncbi:MAG: hypothetical protein QOI10_4085 [Solirubrobacterales bacterium]|jgi:capsular polysaccharide biosynthesis protein|nr:hypothetical protein [Solirubrobacterales bacterium]
MLRLPGPFRRYFPPVKRAVLRTTERAAPVTRRFSRVFGERALPQGSAWETADYAVCHPGGGVSVVPVAGPEELRRPLPEGDPPDHGVFAAHRSITTTPAFAATVQGGAVVGPYGAVLTEDRTLLFDLSPYFGVFTPDHHPIYLRLRLPPEERLPGTAAVLTTRGVDNYCHFLLDVVPRLHMLEAAGLAEGVDHYVVNRSLPFQRQILEQLGVPDDKVVESSAHPHLRCGRLVVSSLAGYDLQLPGWVVPHLRERLGPGAAPAAPRRRIYISRGQTKNTRRVTNEAEVLTALGRFGVTPVTPETLTVEEQIRLFSEAELIVAPHGAALTNIVFCAAGATVVELFAPDYVNSCFWALSCQVEGLRYRYLVGEGPLPNPGQAALGVASDINVDVAKLTSLLERI